MAEDERGAIINRAIANDKKAPSKDARMKAHPPLESTNTPVLWSIVMMDMIDYKEMVSRGLNWLCFSPMNEY